MRIIEFIGDQQLVEKILEHLDLWNVKRKHLHEPMSGQRNIEKNRLPSLLGEVKAIGGESPSLQCVFFWFFVKS